MKLSRRSDPTVLVALALVFALGTATAFASPHGGPRVKFRKHGGSLNWSGYAVETSLTAPQSGVVTDVEATWTVPAVGGAAGYSSTWVGIDGYSNGTVEQIGTEQDVLKGGGTRYYAWYEMYPRMSVAIPVAIGPGDVVSGKVTYGGGTFTLTLRNATHGVSYTTNQTLGTAQRTSAEWIVEAPSAGRILPLADFATESFTQCSATLDGTHAGITRWPYDAMTMVTRKAQTKAQPWGLASDGSAFNVDWYHQ